MIELASLPFNPDILYISEGYFDVHREVPSHYHDSIEIGIVLEGPTHYYINEKAYLVETGDIIILNPYTSHYEKQETGNSHHMHLGLDNFQFLGYDKNIIPIVSPIIKNTFSPAFRHIINRLIEEKNAVRPFQDLTLKILVAELLAYILREIAEQDLTIWPLNQKEKDTTMLANSIKYYLEAHHSEDISLDSLSSSMYVSPTYMSKLFKKETGDSPINYLIKVRMEKAKILLSDNHLSIKEIATSVGYQDAYHFSKLFKKYSGISPRDYQKQPKKAQNS